MVEKYVRITIAAFNAMLSAFATILVDFYLTSPKRCKHSSKICKQGRKSMIFTITAFATILVAFSTILAAFAIMIVDFYDVTENLQE